MATGERHPFPLMFAYWGRRGALSRLTFNMASAVRRQERADITISISRSNEIFEEFARFGNLIFPVTTFSSSFGALTNMLPLMKLRRSLAARFAAENTYAFISLISHVWSPLVVPVIRRAAVRHIVIVHDAARHAGDLTGMFNRWLLHEALAADRIVTLSEAVADTLISTSGIPAKKIEVLFHPDLDYSDNQQIVDSHDGPLRILFMGRILPYKGLGLFVDAIESLYRREIKFEVGVFGAGNLGKDASRLASLGAEVRNRWIGDDEFKSILARYDVVVLSHVAASQSGVVATAFGAGIPVIVTPVGGLVEQVQPEVTGIVASEVTSEALAQAILRLAMDRPLLNELKRQVGATAQSRSMDRFVSDLTQIALNPHS